MDNATNPKLNAAATPSSTHDRTLGHLAKLATELRLQIYTHALARPTPLHLRSLTERHAENWNHIDRSSYQPNLLRLNRQMRAESLPLFYALNCFQIALDFKFGLRWASQWLYALPEQAPGALRWLLLQGRGGVVVDLREGKVGFGQPDGAGEESADGDDEQEHPATLESDWELESWQVGPWSHWRPSGKQCLALKEYMRERNAVHEEEGLRWSRQEIMRLIEIFAGLHERR